MCGKKFQHIQPGSIFIKYSCKVVYISLVVSDRKANICNGILCKITCSFPIINKFLKERLYCRMCKQW